MTDNFCSQCGTQLQVGARFCPNCGQGIDSAVPQTIPPSQAASSTAQKKPIWALFGIVIIAIGLIISVVYAVGARDAAVEKFVRETTSASEPFTGRRIPESTARELAKIDNVGEKESSTATGFAAVAFLIGVPAIIFLARRYFKSRSDVNEADEKQSARKKAIASLVLGIIASVFAILISTVLMGIYHFSGVWGGLMAIYLLLSSPIGIILGMKAKNRFAMLGHKSGRAMALTGIVINAVPILLVLAVFFAPNLSKKNNTGRELIDLTVGIDLDDRPEPPFTIDLPFSISADDESDGATENKPEASRGTSITASVTQGVSSSPVKVSYQPPQPQYPPMARAAKIKGAVVVEIEIDTNGVPTSAIAISGPQLLRKSAEKYAMQHRFYPTKVDGVAQRAKHTLSVNYDF